MQTFEINFWIIIMYIIRLIQAPSSNITSGFFMQDNRYSGIISSIGHLWLIYPTTLVVCSHHCLHDKNCVAMFYIGTLNHCYGIDYRMHDLIAHSQNTDARYYEIKGPFGNMAYKKSTVQSSSLISGGVPEPFHSQFAVDGRRDPTQNTIADHSCSHTLPNDATPYWIVDLGSSLKISTVAILSRIECCGERMAGMTIGVGSGQTGPYEVCAYYPGPGFINEMKTFTCSSPIVGQFVRISKTSPILNMCEVEIY